MTAVLKDGQQISGNDCSTLLKPCLRLRGVTGACFDGVGPGHGGRPDGNQMCPRSRTPANRFEGGPESLDGRTIDGFTYQHLRGGVASLGTHSTT